MGLQNLSVIGKSFDKHKGVSPPAHAVTVHFKPYLVDPLTVIGRLADFLAHTVRKFFYEIDV